MFIVRIFIVFIFYMMLLAPIYAQQPLEASISKSWSIEEVRKLAFENVEYNKDLSEFQPHDPNYKENQKAKKNGISFIKNRFITYFSDGSYNIAIIDNLTFDKYFTYDFEGNLAYICYQKFPKHIKNVNDYYRSQMDNSIYPIKVYKYSYSKGDLICVYYYINGNNQYVYKPDGEFIEYWVDNNCYDLEGNIIKKRDTKPFTEE